MHSYTNRLHEETLAVMAQEVGFTQISSSSETSPLIKIVPRGDTTVVDAYLSPILRRYVEQVAGTIDVGSACERLLFMQSNGGLTPAAQPPRLEA